MEAVMAAGYQPGATFPVECRDIEFRKSPTRTLLARIYQPVGPGPFPPVLHLHGGAWNNKDRLHNPIMASALAASGLLLVSIDLTRAPEAPYPANVQDAHLGIRWLKAHAREWNADPDLLGIVGSSSGGHIAQLIAMQPRKPVYGALALAEAPDADAGGIRYVATRSPISDPQARYDHAQARAWTEMIDNSHRYFKPWETISEANPQAILDRGEAVELPPMLVMQGGADDNVLPGLQERFAESYRAAGGTCELEIFDGCDHAWVDDPGPQTDRAIEVVKAFIARSLAQPAR
jgi:acetyl esterase/lipase